jgi:dTDP-4-dehydrorhamnose reductase
MSGLENILVLGSKGFLGSYLADSFNNQSNIYTCFKDFRGDLALELNGQVIGTFENTPGSFIKITSEIMPKYIFNAIGLIDSSICEENQELAFNVNADIPLALAKASSKYGSRLIHYSTDAVFGQSGSQFSELDKPLPSSVYGASKLKGEDLIRKFSENHVIIRSNFVGYHSKKRTLFNFFYNNFINSSPAFGYSNVIFNPTYVLDVTAGSKDISNSDYIGTVHLVGGEVVSKFTYGSKILEMLDLPKGLLKEQFFLAENDEGKRKLDLTLKSDVLESLYRPRFDINSGISDSILKAKVDVNES